MHLLKIIRFNKKNRFKKEHFVKPRSGNAFSLVGPLGRLLLPRVGRGPIPQTSLFKLRFYIQINISEIKLCDSSLIGELSWSFLFSENVISCLEVYLVKKHFSWVWLWKWVNTWQNTSQHRLAWVSLNKFHIWPL